MSSLNFKVLQAQGMVSFTPQWKPAPQRGQAAPPVEAGASWIGMLNDGYRINQLEPCCGATKILSVGSTTASSKGRFPCP
jgi:hypothetical protein